MWGGRGGERVREGERERRGGRGGEGEEGRGGEGREGEEGRGGERRGREGGGGGGGWFLISHRAYVWSCARGKIRLACETWGGGQIQIILPTTTVHVYKRMHVHLHYVVCQLSQELYHSPSSISPISFSPETAAVPR